MKYLKRRDHDLFYTINTTSIIFNREYEETLNQKRASFPSKEIIELVILKSEYGVD